MSIDEKAFAQMMGEVWEHPFPDREAIYRAVVESYEAAKAKEQHGPRENCPWKCKSGDEKCLCAKAERVDSYTWCFRDDEELLRHVQMLYCEYVHADDKNLSGDAVELKKRLIAIARPMRESGWQPIETAPKDGRWVLAGDNRTPRHVDLVWFQKSKSQGWNNGRGFFANDYFTHWMPLPNPPSNEIEDRTP